MIGRLLWKPVRYGLQLVGAGTITGGLLCYYYDDIKALKSHYQDAKKNRVLVIPFDRINVHERSSRRSSLSSWTDGTEYEIGELVRLLHTAASDPDIKAVYATFGARNSRMGWAHLEELRGALMVIQQAHRRHAEPNLLKTQQVIPKVQPKPIFGYADNGVCLQQYYLMTACTDIHLQKACGELHIYNGALSPQYYIRDWLQKNGVQVHVFKQGFYKTAPNFFTHRRMDQYQAHNVGSIQEGIEADVGNTIVEARSKALFTGWIEKNGGMNLYKRIFNVGTLSAETAWKAGLVDYVPKCDPLPTLLKKGEAEIQMSPTETPAGKFPQDAKTISLEEYANQKRRTWTRDYITSTVRGFFSGASSGSDNNKKPLAIVHINGIIGDSQAETIVDSVTDLDKSNTAAIVLRVNSSGGTLPACERIKNALDATGLPITVSMGNTAASGGYYVSTVADRIWASRKTITGSIGVFGARVDLSKAAAKHGISTDTVPSSSDLAGTNQPFLPMNHKMKENLSNTMDRYYEVFTDTVKEGRGLEDVEKVAGGRVWLGEDALNIGLVDAIGGMYRAVAYAKREYGASEDVIVLPKKNAAWKDFTKGPSLANIWRNAGNGVGVFLATDDETVVKCLLDQAEIPASWLWDAEW